MKISIRQREKGAEPKLVFDRKFKAGTHMTYMPAVLNSGSAIYKHGRLIDVKYIASSEDLGRFESVITFTESEIYQLAKRCRRGQGDEEFLKLIMGQDIGRAEP